MDDATELAASTDAGSAMLGHVRMRLTYSVGARPKGWARLRAWWRRWQGWLHACYQHWRTH